MSFSFSARGKTRDALKADVAARMAAVAENQPAHAADQALVNEVAGKYADLVAEPGPDEELQASVHGSLMTETTRGVRSANVGVTVYVSAATTA